MSPRTASKNRPYVVSATFLLLLFSLFIIPSPSQSRSLLRPATTVIVPPGGWLSGTWKEHARMLTPRAESAAAVWEGVIYVAGGFGGLRSFQAYDVATDTWFRKKNLPEQRHHAMSAAINGRVYVIGGAQPDWTATNTVWAYDPAADSFTAVQPMPEPRSAGAAVSAEGFIYLIGGVGGSNALLRYDPAADVWTSLAPLQVAREHVAGAALDGKLYAIGGRWQGAGELSSVEMYDIATDTWTSAAPLNEPRAGFGAAVIGDYIVVAGGEIFMTGPLSVLDTAEVYWPVMNTWTLLPKMPIPLHGNPVVSVGEQVFVVGGSLVAAGVNNPGTVLSFNLPEKLS
jgi:N-acetylneuraminic acid mutarotase